MLTGTITSPRLRALLEFESQRHDVPIRFTRALLNSDFRPPPFLNEVVIVSHYGGRLERVGLPVGDDEAIVRTQIGWYDEGEPIGYQDRHEGLVPLGRILNNVLVVLLSLEDLDADGAVVAYRSRNGNARANVLSAVFDMIVSQAMPKVVKNIKAHDWAREKKLFAEDRVRRVTARILEVREDIARNDSSVIEKLDEVRCLTRKNVELKDTLQALETDTRVRQRRDAEREFMAVMAMAPGAYESITIDDYYITATTHPITIEYNDHEFELGRMKVGIDLSSERVTIKSVDGPAPDGQPHPHVSRDGTPCWGNIGPGLAKMLAQGQYAGALTVLGQYLRSYNSRDAYLRIERWDPDWRDDKYDRCFEDTFIEDCMNCTDSDCPYYDNRYDRCFDDHEQRDCIACRDCDNYHRAQRLCREQSDRRDCIRCAIRACDHSCLTDDMEACRDNTNDLATCIDCDVDECGYHNLHEDMVQCRVDTGGRQCADCSAGGCDFQGVEPYVTGDTEPAEPADLAGRAQEETHESAGSA